MDTIIEMHIIISLALFFCSLALIAIIRSKKKDFTINNIDIVASLTPVIIYLFSSGYIKEITFADFTVELAFKQAAEVKVEKNVTPLPVKEIPIGNKSTYSKIPRLIKDEVVGLRFVVGYRGYDASQIEYYLDELGKHDFFKYIIVESESGEFIAMTTTDKFYPPGDKKTGVENIKSFLDSIMPIPIHNSTSRLLEIDNFIEDSVTNDTEKNIVLQKMIDNQTKYVPVLDDDKKLIGVVNQGDLAASMLVEIANNINHK